MERAAQTRTITVRIANYDDNQHAANENLRLAESVGGNDGCAARDEVARKCTLRNRITISDSTNFRTTALGRLAILILQGRSRMVPRRFLPYALLWR